MIVGCFRILGVRGCRGTQSRCGRLDLCGRRRAGAHSGQTRAGAHSGALAGAHRRRKGFVGGGVGSLTFGGESGLRGCGD